MKKKIKNNYLTLLAFVLPVIIMAFVFMIKELFTRYNIAISDMYYQYVPFFNYYKDIFDEGIIYNLKNNLGGSAYGTFFYYLSSPLNVIFLIFKNVDVLNILPFLIMIKIGLCGLTMYLYLKSHYKKDKFMLIFSTCYALMAYNIDYYFNIMWLDGVYLLPLILMGLDRLLKENKALLYIVTLFLAILSNYYIAYMICIFLVIYTIHYLIINYHDKRETFKLIKRFIITSLLTGLLCTFIYIPVIKELAMTSKASGSSESLKLNFDFNFLSKIFIGTSDNINILNRNYMCLYCGLIVLPLLYFYFVNKKIKLKEKLVSLGIIIFMILPYFIPALNMAWHGFNFPVCFNYRYSFLLSFYLIIISYKSFTLIDKIDLKHYLIIYLLFIIFSITYIVLMNLKIIDISYLKLLKINISVVSLSLILFLLKNYKQKLIGLLLIITAIAELYLNAFLSVRDYVFLDKKQYTDYMRILKENITFDDNYRFEKDNFVSYNDALILGYNGISSFNSNLNMNNYRFFDKIGYLVYNNRITYSNANLIIDSILGVNQLLLSVKFDDYIFNKSFKVPALLGNLYGAVNKEYYLYENPYALSYGFMVDKGVLNKMEKTDKLNYSSEILSQMVGEKKEYFKRYEYKKDGDDYYLEVTNDYPTYIYVEGSFNKCDNNNYLQVTLGNNSYIFNACKTNYFSTNSDGKIKATVKKVGKVQASEPVIGYYDVDLITEDLLDLRKQSLIVTDMKSTKIKGYINVMKDNVLFLSIPYDDNWIIKVDGKKVPYYKVYDTFIGLDLKKGKHIVELDYQIKSLKPSICISFISLILLIIYRKRTR